MEYTISKTKRNLIIFCAVFLILKAITVVCVFYALDSTNVDITLRGIERILQIVAYGYIMLVLVEYFKYYKLKTLKLITIAILLIEIEGNVISFSKLTGMDVPKLVPMVSSLIWPLAMICWIIFLFRIIAVDFPALISIRRFAIAVISSIVLCATIPIMIDRIINNNQYFELIITVIMAIPYIFIIEFGLKLTQKK